MLDVVLYYMGNLSNLTVSTSIITVNQLQVKTTFVCLKDSGADGDQNHLKEEPNEGRQSVQAARPGLDAEKHSQADLQRACRRTHG